MSYYDELRGQISSLSLNLGEVEYHAARDSLLQMQKYFDEHLLRQLEIEKYKNDFWLRNSVRAPNLGGSI